MNMRKNVVSRGLIGVVLIAGILLVSIQNSRPGNRPVGALPAINPAITTGPYRFGFGVRNLIGATPEDVGRYAQEYAQARRMIRTGTPDVLISRPVTRQEYTALGLGCLPDFAAVEQPPLMLVILKGDIDLNWMPGPVGNIAEDGRKNNYAAYIFDVWSAQLVSFQGSYTGGLFSKVLNIKDSTAPQENWNPVACPTQIPTSQKKLHYGDTAPGFTSPPTLPPNMQQGPTGTEVAVPQMPPPVPTNVSK